MTPFPTKRLRRAALAAIGVAVSLPATGVRVNPDGHGQALIFPFYTARATSPGNYQVTALSIVNTMASAKAVKVRFLEGKTGAEVLDFNLYLSQYDVWTAGVIQAGAGAALFTLDNSCTSPRISNSSANPTLFRNSNYVGNLYGDSLDRTYEGYLEVLEMGSIASGGPLEAAVTHKQDLSYPNASKPRCTPLPSTTAIPAGLLKPSGGLNGNASYINVNEGTDVSVDAIALGQWSDVAQWSLPGDPHPNLADASPAVSTVVDTRVDGDAMIVSRWNTGRDAVSAVLMATSLRNDYSVEPAINAATDWIVTLPTKRFHMNGAIGTVPFTDQYPGASGQSLGYPVIYDREEQTPGAPICFISCYAESPPPSLRFATTTVAWSINGGIASIGAVLGGRNVLAIGLPTQWINGWIDLRLNEDPFDALVAPVGQTTIIDTLTGQATTRLDAKYIGLPAIGFSAQSYSTTGLPGVNPNVLSNYGGSFVHRVTRRIEVTP